jgi:hypothetical protein
MPCVLAPKAHELLVLTVGPLLWGTCSRSPKAMVTYDPWVLGFVFLLGQRLPSASLRVDALTFPLLAHQLHQMPRFVDEK